MSEQSSDAVAAALRIKCTDWAAFTVARADDL